MNEHVYVCVQGALPWSSTPFRVYTHLMPWDRLWIHHGHDQDKEITETMNEP